MFCVVFIFIFIFSQGKHGSNLCRGLFHCNALPRDYICGAVSTTTTNKMGDSSSYFCVGFRSDWFRPEIVAVYRRAKSLRRRDKESLNSRRRLTISRSSSSLFSHRLLVEFPISTIPSLFDYLYLKESESSLV